MDVKRLFAMLTRTALRSATDAGIDAATRSGKPVSDMTPEEQAEARTAKDIARRFRQTLRLARRFFR
jgi:hypothetical protein